MARRLSACHKYNEKQLFLVRISSAPACGTCSRGRLRWNLNCRFGIKQGFPPSPSPKPSPLPLLSFLPYHCVFLVLYDCFLLCLHELLRKRTKKKKSETPGMLRTSMCKRHTRTYMLLRNSASSCIYIYRHMTTRVQTYNNPMQSEKCGWVSGLRDATRQFHQRCSNSMSRHDNMILSKQPTTPTVSPPPSKPIVDFFF